MHLFFIYSGRHRYFVKFFYVNIHSLAGYIDSFSLGIIHYLNADLHILRDLPIVIMSKWSRENVWQYAYEKILEN